MTRRLLFPALLLLLPTLILGGLVLKNEEALSSAQIWRVKITGFDPRNLLYGHYLNFRFDWNWKNKDRSACVPNTECCLCLETQSEANGGAVPQVSYKTCPAAAAQCPGHLPVQANLLKHTDNLFNPEGRNQYFVPEDSAKSLEKLLRDNKNVLAIDLKIKSSGNTQLGELTIDTMPWHEWLHQHPEAVVP